MDGISIRINGVDLADDDPQSLGVVEQWDPDGVKASQASVPIDAAVPRFFDRLTFSETLRFSIFRVHESRTAALEFERLHGRSLPGVSTFEILFPEGGQVWRAHYSEVSIERVKPNRIGYSTDTAYAMSLGAAPTITIDDEVANYLSGGAYYGQVYGPNLGVISGGHYLDGGVPTELAVDGGTYV